MKPIQWLLIGGPFHGETVWIKQGSRVLLSGVLYDGENYLDQGKLYRIGLHSPSFDQRAEVSRLIAETYLAHIAGD